MADLAAELRVTQLFVARLIAEGELQAVRIGSRLVKFRRDDPEAMLRAVPVHGANRLKP
ncbi:excisionase family DNA-binding protein [Cellulomonas sp. Root137]|uniref:excisionase family DNA-binding protein n=1 Tax=Cellulomonas sp. Root137 TaxID=1736459 RepID=UPI0009E6A499|nr:excisionase family DNA-binding protein [Cellulomonas sp. Root137]